MFKLDGFHALKAGSGCQVGDGCRRYPMRQGRAVRLVAVRPFEDGYPLAHHPPRFLERS